MSAYLSNILTQTTSRYNSLRRTLLANEDDGDTEDDSHISRVLRAYYTEKGRPFPPWLPPDPNDRRGLTPQPPYGAAPQQQQGGAAGYFNRTYSAVQAQASTSQRSSLSDLWDAPAAQPAPMQPQSLRSSARRPGQPPPQQQPSAQSLAPPRPLPSQRAGSYQTSAPQRGGGGGGMGYDGQNTPTPPPSAGITAQDRLKAKLRGAGGGGRTPSPLPQQQQGSPYGGYDGRQRQW